jgi:O-antigen ligase
MDSDLTPGIDRPRMLGMDRESILWTLERVTRGSILGYLFTMSIPHTTALRSIFLALALLGTLTRGILTRRNPLHRTVFDIPIIIYVAVILFKTFTSIDVAYSLEMVSEELLKYLAIFYLVNANMDSPRYIERLLLFMLASLMLVSFVGTVGFLEGSLIKSTRATSYFGSFGRAAFYTSMLFPIALGRFLFTRKWWRFASLGFIMAVSIAFMLLTLSRGAWISTLAAVFLLTAIKDRRMFVVLLIVIFIIPWFLPTNVLDRAQSIFQITDIDNNAAFGDRAWLWLSAWDMISERPLLGAGYGNRIFSRIYPDYIYSKSSGTIFANAHNLYLQILVEMGIVGLAAFLLLLFTAGWQIFRLLRKHPGPIIEGHLLGIAGGLTAFVLFSITTYRYENEIALMFWFFLACTSCLQRQIKAYSPDVESERR